MGQPIWEQTPREYLAYLESIPAISKVIQDREQMESVKERADRFRQYFPGVSDRDLGFVMSGVANTIAHAMGTNQATPSRLLLTFSMMAREFLLLERDVQEGSE